MQAASPSTVQASPTLSTPHHVSHSTATADSLRKPDLPRSRARLACLPCRQSKIKCNPDVFPCPNCKKNGKNCAFAESSTGKRSGVTAGHDAASADRASEPRKRKRAAPSATSKDLAAPERDLFNPQLFPEQVWEELYSIFRQHYATEFPFLHETTFLAWLKRTDMQLESELSPLLLAFLALTVPFHKAIVRQLSQDARQVSRRYADAAEAKINELHALAKPSIEDAQALLMLGLRAHGDAQGSKSFILLGNAVSCMQLLGCHREEELDAKKRSNHKQEPRDSVPIGKDRIIQDEVKRRTFWSCFIIDRYISSGDYKPRKLHMEDTLVQLPCSDDAFDYGLFKIKTRMLRETDDQFKERRAKYYEVLDEHHQQHPDHSKETDVQWEDEDKQDALAWFIKALDIYGDVMRYVCTVTRRNETEYPWAPPPSAVELNFYNLDKRVDSLISKLPANLKLNPQVRDVHIHRRRATPYVLLHSTLSMCKIALHREYFPFLTDPVSFPNGPGDDLMADQLKRACARMCPDFWQQSARICFQATKDCYDLLVISEQRGALVETPLTAFICYTVVFTIMWCAFYPNMDQDGLVCKGTNRADTLVIENYERGFALLRHLQKRMFLARTLCKRLNGKVFDTLINWRTDFIGNLGGSPTEHNSLRAYLEFEKEHKQFGVDDDPDNDAAGFEEAKNLRILLNPHHQGSNVTDHKDTPSTIKSEVKSDDGVHSGRNSESTILPPLRSDAFPPTFTPTNRDSVSSKSTNRQVSQSSHVQVQQSPIYQSTFSNRYPPHAMDYGLSKDRISAGTLENHHTTAEYVTSSNGVYTANFAQQLIQNYPDETMTTYAIGDQSFFTGDWSQQYDLYPQSRQIHPYYNEHQGS